MKTIKKFFWTKYEKTEKLLDWNFLDIFSKKLSGT